MKKKQSKITSPIITFTDFNTIDEIKLKLNSFRVSWLAFQAKVVDQFGFIQADISIYNNIEEKVQSADKNTNGVKYIEFSSQQEMEVFDLFVQKQINFFVVRSSFGLNCFFYRKVDNQMLSLIKKNFSVGFDEFTQRNMEEVIEDLQNLSFLTSGKNKKMVEDYILYFKHFLAFKKKVVRINDTLFNIVEKRKLIMDKKISVAENKMIVNKFKKFKNTQQKNHNGFVERVALLGNLFLNEMSN